MSPQSKRVSIVLIFAALTDLSLPTLADPPAHARAHGWRAKHVGHTGNEWELDYGVVSGTCNRKAVVTVLGGITGGVSYQLSPGVDRNLNGEECREFDLLAISGSDSQTKRGLACESVRGVWAIVEYR